MYRNDAFKEAQLTGALFCFGLVAIAAYALACLPGPEAVARPEIVYIERAAWPAHWR